MSQAIHCAGNMGHLAMESDTTGLGITGGGTAAAAKATAAAAPKPRARRPAAARKPVVISDSEDDASDSGGDSDLQLDDDDRCFPCAQLRGPNENLSRLQTAKTHTFRQT